MTNIYCIMKKYITLLIFLSLVIDLGAQSIRKNYQEMTDSERTELVNAFYQLRLGPDLVDNLANFHADNFDFGISTVEDLHFNLPNEPQRQIFFAWHRFQMYEMEQAMQAINPNISIPWWDSSVDQLTTSPVWNQNFMGSFNVNWGLGRNFGLTSLLPTPAVVTQAMSRTDFLIFANEVERQDTHRGAHRWVGGVMPTGVSPRDPIFYLHHTYIDKLWDDWEKNPVNDGSSHIIDHMLRYNGSTSFNGQLLPLVNPSLIHDSKALGIFYAENQLAELFDYTVSIPGSSTDLRNSLGQTIENFYYQFVIDVGNNFNVPSGANCNIESVNEIRLLPGFTAFSGSTFIAKIDSDNNINTTAKNKNVSEIVSNNIPFTYNPAILNPHAYDPKEYIADNIIISIYPNPFTDRINIEMNKNIYNNTVNIYDLSGRIVMVKTFEKKASFEIDNLHNLSNGIYILEVIADGEIILRKKIFKN
jgi:tyrosinase